MNLNQLEYFVCAAHHLNFTKAAKECYISQTAMTQQIQALERNIGVQLFIRDKHHMELTTAGKVYLKEAKAILKRSDEAIRLARMASTGMDGELSVGFISGFGQSDGYELLRGFHEAFPDIKLKFFRNTMSGLMEYLQKGECDIAFTVQPHQRAYENMNRQYIRSYPLYVVMSRNNPLAEEKEITCKELKDQAFIIMQPTARSRDEMEEMLWVYQRGGFLPQVVAVEKEPETIMLMAALEMGVSLLPEYIVRPYSRNEELAIVPVMKSDGTAETLNFEMVWPTDNANPSVENLLEWWKGDTGM
ncbi:MAG: LysR family transcriptional regulator [Lachnospiraceae bacterium]|nr:LysR family transcriptional regulator [Lachnospiraceae bacterium]